MKDAFERMMMQQSMMRAQSPVYCRLCGKDLKMPSIHLDKGNEEELRREMHYKCFIQQNGGMRK